jgi:methyl-accepting chemotaxis protein
MQWFNNMKIGTKLISSFCLVALIAGAIGYVGISSLKAADDSDTILYEKNTLPISQLGEISIAFQRIRVNSRDMILATTPEEIQSCAEKIDELSQTIAKNAAEYEKSIMTDEGKKLYDELKD